MVAVGQTIAGLARGADPDKQSVRLQPALVLNHGGFFRPPALGGRDFILLALAFSPDGKTIASARGGHPEGADTPAQGKIKLWEVATGKLLRTIAIESGIVFDAKFSANGRLLATASGPGTPIRSLPGEIRLWNPATGLREQLVLPGGITVAAERHKGRIVLHVESPDGER
jgi:FOG: WD40 repeat